MDLNKSLSTVYRWTAISFLMGIFAIAFSYAFLVIFYITSSTWSAPLVLSPSQDKVLSYQPQIASMYATLDKQHVDMATAKGTVLALSSEVTDISKLQDRLSAAMKTQSTQLGTTSKELSSLLVEKAGDIQQTQAAVNAARQLLSQVQSELAAHLITSDQAAERTIALQSAINTATDARAQAIQLEKQASDFRQGSETLKGSATSIEAVSYIKQLTELHALRAQLDIQLVTAQSTIDVLQRSIVENERVLYVAKQSPYYKALREPITVVFVPYANLGKVHIGDPVYDCYLQVVACRRVGYVDQFYEAEEYARHPLFKSDLKGRLVGVKFEDVNASKSQVVFIGGKPLFL